SKTPKVEKLDIRKEITKYLKQWYWFLIILSICLGGGYYYLKYTTPVYSAKTTIILQDEAGSGAGSVVYSDLGLNTMASNNLTNEIGILNSRRLMKDVVKSLNLHIQYFKKGNVRDVELYMNSPISVQVFKLDEEKLNKMGTQNFTVNFK